MAPELDPHCPPPGAVIDGKYRVERLLGRGGMGVVAAATHLLRRAPVALKFLDPGQMGKPGWGDRFMNEAVLASKIDSEHVVRVYDVGRLPGGAPFIVMELLEGLDLEQRLQAEPRGRFEVAQAVDYVLQILRALQVAHAAGVVHRDLKPANAFLVERDGEGELVKLLDFGIGRFVEADGGDAARLTQANVALGTPLYISPEQARDAHNATPRSDLYSVGAMLYELLSGRTPFEAETANELLFQLFTQAPRPLDEARPGLPPGLVAVAHRALSKDPAERPASAVAFAQLLAPFADERSARVLERLTRPPSAPGPLTPRSRSRAPAPGPDDVAPTVRSAPSLRPGAGDPPSPGRIARAEAVTALLETPPSAPALPVASARAPSAPAFAASSALPSAPSAGASPLAGAGAALRRTDLEMADDARSAGPKPRAAGRRLRWAMATGAVLAAAWAASLANGGPAPPAHEVAAGLQAAEASGPAATSLPPVDAAPSSSGRAPDVDAEPRSSGATGAKTPDVDGGPPASGATAPRPPAPPAASARPPAGAKPSPYGFGLVK